jgi:hypothetical protein
MVGWEWAICVTFEWRWEVRRDGGVDLGRDNAGDGEREGDLKGDD